MAKLILFSGACNSGKTTTLKAFAKRLQDEGYKVVVLDELIRNVTDKPIDELRKDVKAYLTIQNKIICEKIEQEKVAIEDMSDTIYLADRAVTDSMFYLENYVDKSKLDEDDIKLYCKLHRSVHEYLKRYFWRYTLVVEFQAIDIHEVDMFRPRQIELMKEYEQTCIARLNFSYSNGYKTHNFTPVDLNYMTVDEVIEKIAEETEI